MTFPDFDTPEHRLRWLHITALAWLLIISLIVIADHVVLSRLSPSADGSAQIDPLGEQLAKLEQQIQTLQDQPTTVSQTDFDTAHQALADRLQQVEVGTTSALHVDALNPIETRLAALEAGAAKQRRISAASRQHANAPTPPKIIAPPFSILGMERRGDERFVAIASDDSHASLQTRLLGLGDIEAGWRLDAIDNGAAIFLVDGQSRRIAVP